MRSLGAGLWLPREPKTPLIKEYRVQGLGFSIYRKIIIVRTLYSLRHMSLIKGYWVLWVLQGFRDFGGLELQGVASSELPGLRRLGGSGAVFNGLWGFYSLNALRVSGFWGFGFQCCGVQGCGVLGGFGLGALGLLKRILLVFGGSLL